MSPLCDVCHAEAATVGAFCPRCSKALLDAEAVRVLNLQKAGEEEQEQLRPHPVECFSSFQERHERYRMGLKKNLRSIRIMRGGL